MKDFITALEESFWVQLKSGYKGQPQEIDRFPDAPSHSSPIEVLKRIISKRYLPKSRINFFLQRKDGFLKKYGDKFKYLYDILEDENSRQQLLSVVLFEILKYYYKFPTEDRYIRARKISQEMIIEKHELPGHSHSLNKLQFYKFNIPGSGSNVVVPRLSYTHNFVLEQYRYISGDSMVGVKPGDVIIDGGAFVGDSAIYFANRTGKKGRVYSFEFMNENLSMLRENCRNFNCNDYVEVVQKALWSKPGLQMSFQNQGWASRLKVSNEPGLKIGRASCRERV